MSETRRGKIYNRSGNSVEINTSDMSTQSGETARNSITYKKLILPIKKYEGDPVKLTEFLEEYQLYAQTYGWTDEMMVVRFPLHVQGTARQIVTNLSDEDKVNFQGLGTAITPLTNTLLTHTPSRTHRELFRARVQKPNETVTQYAYDLKNMSTAAFQGMNDDITNDLLYEQFMFGLAKHLRTHVTLADLKTFDASVQKAQLLESMENPTINEVNLVSDTKMNNDRVFNKFNKNKYNNNNSRGDNRNNDYRSNNYRNDNDHYKNDCSNNFEGQYQRKNFAYNFDNNNHYNYKNYGNSDNVNRSGKYQENFNVGSSGNTG